MDQNGNLCGTAINKPTTWEWFRHWAYHHDKCYDSKHVCQPYYTKTFKTIYGFDEDEIGGEVAGLTRSNQCRTHGQA